MKPLRILLADDHEMVRRGLRATLSEQREWQVCAEAVNGLEAVTKARDTRPDIAIMDISMPELNGLEATRRLSVAAPRTQTLILTMHDSDDLVREVLAAGARGYLLKTDAGRLLVQAVDALSNSRPFFTRSVAEKVLAGFLRPCEEPERPALSPREREIVQLVAEGRSSKEIAGLLDLSVKTVETHRANIMQKLQLRSVADLVRYAIRSNIITA